MTAARSLRPTLATKYSVDCRLWKRLPEKTIKGMHAATRCRHGITALERRRGLWVLRFTDGSYLTSKGET